MHTGIMFLDCPAYTDRRGTARCGLPAEVEDRYTVSSTEGPQESVNPLPARSLVQRADRGVDLAGTPQRGPFATTRTAPESAWPRARKQRVSEPASQTQAMRPSCRDLSLACEPKVRFGAA